MGVTKIRTLDSDDNKLAEKCMDETKCGDCSKPDWTTHQDGDSVKPPEGTVAVVVDVRNNTAAIRIFESESEDFVDMVGTEEAGKLVIVPWQSDWFYFCTGSPRVGIVKKS